MNFKLISVDTPNESLLIEWEDGVVLNHNIPVDYLRQLIKPENPLINERPNIRLSMEALIRMERQ